MSEKTASISSIADVGESAQAQNSAAALPPAEVDYVVAMSDIENPFGIAADKHKKVMYVYKVLSIDGEIVQFLSLEGMSIVDDRYLIN